MNEADCLALVEQSPTAVAVHDKAAWLRIFARYNVVEDPVGSAPHTGGLYDRRQGYRGDGRLSRFYETFIAANTIRFHVDRDIVCGLHVVRDLTIEIVMSPQVVVRVPMHLLYELTVEATELKIFRLAAHWELRPMLKQQMVFGWSNIKVGSASAGRMLRYLGIGGVVGFMRALSSVGTAGKQQTALFATYFNQGKMAGLEGLFANPGVKIAFPHAGRRLSIADCAGMGGQMRFSKVLAAGNFVTATVNYEAGQVCHGGVAFFELDRRTLRIVALSFYWQGQ